MSALRIGFVMLHTSPLDVPGTKDAGGMNVVVRAQADALASSGHEVTIFTRRSDPATPPSTVLESGLVVVQIDAGPARLLAKGEHEAVMAQFGEGLHAALQHTPVDLLHAEHWFSGIAALPVARREGIPLVQSYHSIAAPPESPLTDGERPESPGRLAGERRLAHEADLVIAVSEAERRTVLDRLAGDPARVLVVPLGVDTELFHPCTDPHGVQNLGAADRGDTEHSDTERGASAHGSGDRAEVILVGRLHPLKGFDLAIDAVAALPPELRPTLRIVGAAPPDGDDYVRALHEAVAKHGMSDTTVFEGALPREELAKRVRCATVMLVPSHSETFGLVALEASASGVPVIARDTGGLREAVVDGETGLLVRGDDPRVWAAALSSLLEDPQRIAPLARRARPHALAHNWAASAERLLDVYRGLLTAETPAPLG